MTRKQCIAPFPERARAEGTNSELETNAASRGRTGFRYDVVHVVAFDGDGGEYGGPMRVATELAEAQANCGMSVALVAAHPYAEAVSEQRNGVIHLRYPAHFLLRSKLGFAGLTSPRLLANLMRHSNSSETFHIHLARDLLTLPAALLMLLKGSSYIVQTHGMIDEPTRPLARTLDRLATGPAVRASRAAAVLTTDEGRQLQKMRVSSKRIHLVPNGVRLEETEYGGATSDNVVLFLARLHPRKGAITFAKAASLLIEQGTGLDFVIAGPDEGDHAEVSRIIEGADIGRRVKVLGPIPPRNVRHLMANSCLYVLPAEKEPFGMTVLEALSAGTPVLLHESALLAERLRGAGVATVYSGGAESLAAAITEATTTRPSETSRERTRQYVRDDFSLAAIKSLFDALYTFQDVTRDPEQKNA